MVIMGGMKKKNWRFLWMALAGLVVALSACSRFSRTEATLVPTRVMASATARPEDTPVLPSRTPTASPTPTATPTSTPTPTPLPAVRIEMAERALHNGDYARAQALYQSLPLKALDASEAARTRLGLARSLLAQADDAAAADVARDLLDAQPDHPSAVDAQFLLAEASMGSGDYAAAAEAYQAYLDAEDVLAPFVQLWIGDAHSAAGAYEAALAAYQQAVDTAPTSDLVWQAREKMGLAYGYTGDYAAALAEYDAIIAGTADGNLRARIQYQAAQTLLVAGERDAAYARLQNLVTYYYKTPAAYDALVDLINSGQPVSEFQRGLVDYYNGAYDAAVAAFYRAIEADLAGHDGAPHYFAALSYRAAGNYAAAINELDVLIDTHPGDAYVDDGWLAKAWTQYLAGSDEAAVETYTRFVAGNPGSGLAPEALWWAANIRFWDDEYAAAAALFEQLAEGYPRAEYAAQALYRAAFCRYQLGAYEEAATAWGRYPLAYPGTELLIGAHFWQARTYLETGKTLSATQAFSRAVAAGPLDYYSQRALDYQVDLDQPRAPLTRPAAALSTAGFDEDVARAATDVWLGDGLGLSHTEAVTLSQLAPALAADPRLLRGQALWRLGRQTEAKQELEWLRRDTATDLRAQYQLAIFFRDLGLYRSSILAAEAALRLSPARSPFDAPAFLARLAYPTYYADLVLPEAGAYDLDPLLVFALVRQESLFEGFATSFAYAHGLMQVIPSTGQSIASSLGWPDYETADLYRPLVSVKFGTWYLAQQRDRFEGLLYPALAAYNAGPGNAQRWLKRTLGACDAAGEACTFDYDVFVELIHLYETRLYVRQIDKHFAVYRHLYGEGGAVDGQTGRWVNW